MEMTIQYKRRSYGTGGNAGKYEISFRQRELLVITPSEESVTNSEFKAAVEINFRFLASAAAKGWEELSEAEVVGGDITLTRPAAKTLAEALLHFLESHGATQSEKTPVLIEE